MEIALRLIESEAGEKRQGVQIGLKSRYTGSPIDSAPGELIVICNMKIYEGHDKEGKLVYFEVPHLLLSRRTAINIVKSIPGVEVIKEEIREDVFFTFKVGDRIFEIWEPYGDNSRFHIGEKPVQNSNELEVVKQRFSIHKRSLLATLADHIFHH